MNRYRTMAMVCALFAASCGDSETDEAKIELDNQVIEVACGHCVYDMDGTDGFSCPWSAEVGGEHYLITGPVPQDHEKHHRDGICVMERQARVTGHVHNEYLVLTAFALLPAEGVPEGVPSDHDHDHDHDH